MKLHAKNQEIEKNVAESQASLENQNNQEFQENEENQEIQENQENDESQENQEFQESQEYHENKEFQGEVEDFEENQLTNDDKFPEKLESILSQVVKNAQEEFTAGGVSECIAEKPQIIENYKKEKVIKENAKNIIYDLAIELTELGESKEEKKKKKKKIFCKNYIFRLFGHFFWRGK